MYNSRIVFAPKITNIERCWVECRYFDSNDQKIKMSNKCKISNYELRYNKKSVFFTFSIENSRLVDHYDKSFIDEASDISYKTDAFLDILIDTDIAYSRFSNMVLTTYNNIIGNMYGRTMSPVSMTPIKVEYLKNNTKEENLSISNKFEFILKKFVLVNKFFREIRDNFRKNIFNDYSLDSSDFKKFVNQLIEEL